jgi:hypothetical protein
MSQYYFAVHQGEKIKGGKAAAAKAAGHTVEIA